jgi:hypothetical protein
MNTSVFLSVGYRSNLLRLLILIKTGEGGKTSAAFAEFCNPKK